MTIDVSDNNPRINYSIAEGVTQTVFSVPFEFFEDSNVYIYVDGVLKTEGLDYTLTGGDGSTGTLTFVTATPPDVQQVTGAAGGTVVSIVRHVELERVTDFVAGQDINRAALNEQLDTIVAQIADLDDRVDRTIHLSDWALPAGLTIPSLDDRKGKGLQFNASTGDVETVKLLTGATATASDLSEGDPATASVTVTDGVAAFTIGIPAGATGSAGATGPQGPQGVQGPAGADGADGAAGTNGTNGTDGTNGTNGTDGLGFTGGSYNASTGVVTFTSDDSLGFSTGDLRASVTSANVNPLIDSHLDVSTANTGELLSWNGTDYDWVAAGSGSGSVTSVAATVPSGFLISGSPITSSGTLAITYATGYKGFLTIESEKLATIQDFADKTKASNVNPLVDAHLNTSTATVGQVLSWTGTDYDWIASSASGTVTSVSQTVPTGFTVSGSPITSSGTLAISYDTGYQGYTTTEATKLSGIETGADVTDTANVTDAGALMDSEVTNLAQVKAFDSADYATAAQGSLADSALQSGDNVSALTNDAGYTTNLGDITGVNAGSGIIGGGTSGTVTISHADTSFQSSVNNSGTTVIQDILLDTYGHITAIGSTTLSIPAAYTNSDVDTHLNTSTATSNQILSWTGTDYDWVTNTGGYADSDVDANLNTSTAVSGEVLSWNGTDYDWVSASGYTDADVDTHLNFSTATTGQVLSYNGSDYDWTTISGYTDTDVDTHLNTGTASTGEVLSWNGSDYDWVAVSGGTADIDTHLNTGTAASGEVLSWNGTDYDWAAYVSDATFDTYITSASLTGTTPSVDVGARDTYTLSTSGNTTFTFTGSPSSGQVGTFSLIITAGGTHTLTWPASVDWAGGTAPDAPASGEKDIYTFMTVDGGTNWYGFLAGDAMA